jgi:hypothetical protein
VCTQAVPSFPLHNRYMTSKTTRLAAASLLAVAMPLAQSPTAVAVGAERDASLTLARAQTDVITRDILLAATHTTVLPADLRTATRDAIASAQAATAGARDALRDAGTDDPHAFWYAEVSLQDALTALEAASAEIRHVAGRVSGTDEPTAFALRALLDDLGTLRDDVDGTSGRTASRDRPTADPAET